MRSVEIGCDYRYCGKYKSQKSSAHIPHKQFSLWKVEKKETQGTGSYCVSNDVRKNTSIAKRNITEKYTGYYSRSSSYSVDAIHEIVGVGHAHDP